MNASRRQETGDSVTGFWHARPFPLVAILAIPAAAAAGSLLDGTASWIVAFGAAAIGVTAALASTGRAQAGAAGIPAPTTAAPNANESVLRRAIEVRCAERTAILENLVDAVMLVDGHGETRFANRIASEMLGETAATAGTRAAIEALPTQVLRAVQGVAAARARTAATRHGRGALASRPAAIRPNALPRLKAHSGGLPW